MIIGGLSLGVILPWIEEGEEAAAMVANCKALSRLISVYAIAIALHCEGEGERRGGKLTFPLFLLPATPRGYWLLLLLSPLRVCLSVHPLPSHLPFLPRRNFGLFPPSP